MSVEEYLAYYERYKAEPVEPKYTSFVDLSQAVSQNHIFVFECTETTPKRKRSRKITRRMLITIFLISLCVVIFALVDGGEDFLIISGAFSFVILVLVFTFLIVHLQVSKMKDLIIVGPEGILFSKGTENEFISWSSISKIKKHKKNAFDFLGTFLIYCTLFDQQSKRIEKIRMLAYKNSEIFDAPNKFDWVEARQENFVSVIFAYYSRFANY